MVRECLQIYGYDSDAFLQTFNPDIQPLYAHDKRRTFYGTAPTLVTVSKAYGFQVAKSWLCIQLNNLSEFAGARDKISTRQLEQLADVILANWYYLKLSEFMLFMFKFKSGQYGHFYGSVDAMVITEALCQFCKERITIMSRIEAEVNQEKRMREQEKRAASGECMTREEWEELKWLWNMGYEPERIRKELQAEKQ